MKIFDGPWEPEPKRTPEEQFRQRMLDAGVVPPKQIIFDSHIHRFSTKDGTDDAGWYVGFSDDIHAGSFGDWRTGFKDSFCEDLGRQLSAAEQIKRQEHITKAQRLALEDRKKRQNMTAESAVYIWASCQEASDDHPYLKRKGVKAHGVKVSGDGRLVLPLYDEEGSLSTLQYIDTSGGKLFHPGGAAKNRFFIIGKPSDQEKIYIAEGFATAATIYEETGKPTVVSYSAHNLPGVTGIIRELFPQSSLVVVADNDVGGVGENYASQACAKHGARMVVPPVPGDVNDYRANGGAVQALLSDGDDSILDRLDTIFGEDMATKYDAPDEVFEDVLVSQSIAVLYGASNSGKTFFALALAAAIAEGDEFLGKRVDQGIVVYLASEAPGTIRQRMQAIKRETGKTLANLAMVPVPLNFYRSHNDSNDVIELCKEIERRKGQKVKLIIGDTLARMSSGANENSGEDMAPIMDRFDAVAKATGAALLIIHHSGKNKAAGARGWSGIQAHISTEIEVTEEDGIRCAEVTKQRELPSKGVKVYFDLKVIVMGKGKFGNDVSTCIVVEDKKEHRKKRTKKETEYITMIMKAWAEKSGGEVESEDDLPYISRSALYDYMEENELYKPATMKKYFQPGFKDGPIYSCLRSGDIREYKDGYVISAEDMESVRGAFRQN